MRLCMEANGIQNACNPTKKEDKITVFTHDSNGLLFLKIAMRSKNDRILRIISLVFLLPNADISLVRHQMYIKRSKPFSIRGIFNLGDKVCEDAQLFRNLVVVIGTSRVNFRELR